MQSSRDQPNILFFLADQHHHDWLGVEGVPVRTPTIDRLAKRGVQFTNAVCPSPLCAPSRASLAAGVEYDQSPVMGNQHNFPIDETTYYQLLRDRAGYHVAGCGKFDLHKAEYSWGTDGTYRLKDWGFSEGVDNAGKWDAWDSGAENPQDPYMAYLHREDLAEIHVADFDERKGMNRYMATHSTPLPEEAYCDNWIARRGLDLLERCPREGPWHLVVNFAGPHEPMDVTERMHRWYRGDDLVKFPPPTDTDESQDRVGHQEVRRNYAAMVENIDRWLGTYLERLEERDELSNTVVVFASDHGELLGDHGYWGKHSPYHASVRVPLVVAGPGIEPRGATDAPISLIDLSATFLEWAGVDRRPGTDARSAGPVLRGETDHHRDYVFSGLDPWRLIYDGRYKFVLGWDPDTPDWLPERRPAEREEKSERADDSVEPVLFDLEEDPNETKNVADENPDVVTNLRETLRLETDL